MLKQPFHPNGRPIERDGRVRLWIAELACPGGVLVYFTDRGSPIRYDYVPRQWPLAYYQTVFATEPGSAEMPSAGRPFTREIVQRVRRMGVSIAPVVLHTGVASLEADEPPYPERYRVPEATADLVNRARTTGGQVVAVGTTVVRALETVATPDGRVGAGEGWTELVVTPERGVFAIDAILTGLHAPRASHLAMLEALAGRNHLETAYRSALRHRYLWHEFGDLHLIFGGSRGDLERRTGRARSTRPSSLRKERAVIPTEGAGCHPEAGLSSRAQPCHPERSPCHPERSPCHPERSEGSCSVVPDIREQDPSSPSLLGMTAVATFLGMTAVATFLGLTAVATFLGMTAVATFLGMTAVATFLGMTAVANAPRAGSTGDLRSNHRSAADPEARS